MIVCFFTQNKIIAFFFKFDIGEAKGVQIRIDGMLVIPKNILAHECTKKFFFIRLCHIFCNYRNEIFIRLKRKYIPYFHSQNIIHINILK